MGIEEYEKVYAESRVADIDAQIAANDAANDALRVTRESYVGAAKPKRTRAKANDDKS
jgi:hypothetical protein